jgi:late competence protein required for DNA uptake (superfamily II DNA/RNA helicase)
MSIKPLDRVVCVRCRQKKPAREIEYTLAGDMCKECILWSRRLPQTDPTAGLREE